MGTISTIMNHRAVYNPTTLDIELTESHRQLMTFTQLQQLVRQANVEWGLMLSKSFAFHLFEGIYQFNRKEAINFLMVGVGDIFFDAPRELVLSLTGKYFLGDFYNETKNKYS